MAKQTINIGAAANDGTGDPIRTAFGKVNDNFTEIYTANTGVNTGDQNLAAYATTAAVAAGYQPLDSDLTAIAALTTTAYGRALLSTADAPTLRTSIGLGQTDAPTFGQFITLSDATNFTYVNFGGSNQIQRESSLMWFSSAGSRELGFTIGGPIRLRQGGGISWWDDIRSGTLKASIFSTADNIIEQRNGTAKQTLRIYNTYTSATVYERAVMDWNGPTPGNLQIGTEFMGSGSGMAARPIDFVTGGVARWQISAAGDFLPSTTNFYDIGSQSGNRPKTIWATNGIQTAGGDLSTFGGAGPFYLQSATGRALCFISNTSVIQIGGTTSAFPAIKRNGTGIHIVLADDSGFAPLSSGSFTSDSSISAAASSYIMWGGGTSSRMSAPSNGVIQLTNAATGSFTRLEFGTANLGISRGTGSPEGIVTALVGSLYLRTDGGLLSTLYVKESSPTPNTGWVAK